MTKQEFSKYERARVLGARALQISMDAPLLLKISKEELESMNYDPLKIAEKEVDSGILPISVNKPMPERKSDKLREIKIDELEDKVEVKEEPPIKKEEEKQSEESLKTDEDSEEEMEEEGVEETVEEADSGDSSSEE